MKTRSTTRVNEHENLPIVFQALPKWDSAYASTSLTVAKHLSEDRLVFYVEHPFSRLDAIKPQTSQKVAIRRNYPYLNPFEQFPNLIVIHPPLIDPINVLPEGGLYQYFRTTYLITLWKHIDSVLSSYDVQRFTYVNSFDPVLGETHSQFPVHRSIYHCVDWIGGEQYIAKHGIEAEKLLAEKVDLVITTSEPLKERLSSLNSNTFCVPNAANFHHFSTPSQRPAVFEEIKSKIALYVGNIGLRLDYENLEYLASQNPDITFFFVGPIDAKYFPATKLMQLGNVIFHGAADYSELPAFIQHADVCLIPFEKSELTRNIYPLKINEYLSAGKPILSSNFTDMTEFSNYVYIYDTQIEMLIQFQKALSESDSNLEEYRKDFASKNTWTQRIAQWKHLLHQTEAETSLAV